MAPPEPFQNEIVLRIGWGLNSLIIGTISNFWSVSGLGAALDSSRLDDQRPWQPGAPGPLQVRTGYTEGAQAEGSQYPLASLQKSVAPFRLAELAVVQRPKQQVQADRPGLAALSRPGRPSKCQE